jgi:hypothetical protein
MLKRSPTDYYIQAKKIFAVRNANARLRQNIETMYLKQPNTRELRRTNIRKHKKKIVTAVRKNIFGDLATKKAIVKGFTPKSEHVMLDAFWDVGSQFFKQYVSATVPKVTQELKSISSEWWTKFTKHPKLAFAAGALLGGVVSFNLIRGVYNHAIGAESTIPKNYQKGYDLISEYTSDFGSPVSSSVVTRTLVPYVSSPRRARITSTNAVINSNAALSTHKNAIGHTRY